MNTLEAARQLGVTPRKVRQLCHREGLLHYRNPGRRTRLFIYDLAVPLWLEQRGTVRVKAGRATMSVPFFCAGLRALVEIHGDAPIGFLNVTKIQTLLAEAEQLYVAGKAAADKERP